MSYFLVFAVAVVVTLLTTPAIRSFALKFTIVDRKNFRKVHQKTITRFGGLAIYFGFIFAFITALILNNTLRGEDLFLSLLVIITATLMLILGIYDDIKGADAKIKFTVQILAALILVQSGFYVKFITDPFSGESLSLGFWGIPITILWLVGVTNAINLIDGLDGLAAGIVFIACFGMFFIFLSFEMVMAAFLSIALAGACLGFLRFNFHPAKVFMGDTGSMFLGFSIASLAVLVDRKATVAISLLVPAVIGLAIPILDTAWAFIRRILIKKISPFHADKEHIHHLLMKKKLSTRLTVIILWVLTILLNIFAYIFYANH